MSYVNAQCNECNERNKCNECNECMSGNEKGSNKIIIIIIVKRTRDVMVDVRCLPLANDSASDSDRPRVCGLASSLSVSGFDSGECCECCVIAV